MKTLYDLLAESDVNVTEITHEDKKLWRISTPDYGELIGEIGYKFFNPDWTCRGMQYQSGKLFEEDGAPDMCRRGFHYCQRAVDCFNYYSFNPDNKAALVLACGRIEHGRNKCCTNRLYIVHEISWNDIFDIVNMGERNTGLYNTGNCNVGNCNTGHQNVGYHNVGNNNKGNCNTGYCNIGDHNTGMRNVGDHNTGNYNFGNYCTGDYNLVDGSTGVFCTEEQTIKIFDVDSGLTLEQWRKTEAAKLLSFVKDPVTIRWVSAHAMTDEEKSEYPNYEKTNGCLRVIKNGDRFIEWWRGLNKSEQTTIKNIPGFNPEKFKKITGVDVMNPDGHVIPIHVKKSLDVGDKVIIRTDLSRYDDVPFGVSPEMERYAGKTAIITSVSDPSPDGSYPDIYKINLDGEAWNWSSPMFEKNIL